MIVFIDSILFSEEYWGIDCGIQNISLAKETTLQPYYNLVPLEHWDTYTELI